MHSLSIRISSIRLILIWFLLAVIGFTAQAQKTVVQGKVFDITTRLPIPYAYVTFKGFSEGTITDSVGVFSLVSPHPRDSVQFTVVGYGLRTVGVKRSEVNTINIGLKDLIYDIEEVDVKPGENPAHIILRNVITHKEFNDPSDLPPWNANVYNKVQIDLKNVERPDTSKRIWKQFDFVFDNIDTLETDNKLYLPVFITETLSDVYHEDGKDDLVKIMATKVSGMQTSIITEFVGKIYQDVNPYDNYISLGDVSLVSPFNWQGLLFYRYYLLDSVIVDGQKIYELSFRPRMLQEPTFKGKFWIADSTFAVTRVEMTISGNVNINFLNDFIIKKSYEYNGNRWLPKEEFIFADLNFNKGKDSKMVGLIGRKTTVYKSFDFVTRPIDADTKKEAAFSTDTDLARDEVFWKQNRPVQLRKEEEAIYNMVDSIKNIPLFKTVVDYVEMFFFGYKRFGKYEFGPYYYSYSYNKIEGNRLRLGGRTNIDFSKKIRLNAYTAYGFGDKDLKYGGGFEYFFRNNPRFSVKTQYEHDYQLLGKSDNAFMEDNILTTVLSKHPSRKLNLVDKIDFRVTKEWTGSLSNRIGFNFQKIYSSPYVPFISNGNTIDHFAISEITMNTRWAPGEKFILSDFERIGMGSKYPEFNVNVNLGLKDVLGGEYNYQKISLSVYDKLNINPFGYTTYFFQAGRIFGDVPFPLLKIHEGNETYAFDIAAFNLLDYHSFVSDHYASLFIEHHFQGFFLNKIPLLQKLKWREVIGLRLLEGKLDPAKHQDINFPVGMVGLGDKPYMEASVGIENILKIIRVDAVWRINYKTPTSTHFGILFSFQFGL